jgi:hypothetical protein
MVGSGDTVALKLYELYDVYNLLPYAGANVNLTVNLTIDPDGTPKEGMKLTFNYGGKMVNDGGSVIVFGRTLTVAEMLSPYLITCEYINGAWVVNLIYGTQSAVDGADLTALTVTNAKLAGSIVLSKLLAATEGFMIRAGASGIWESFAASVSGNLIVSNGTIPRSVAMSGATTIDANGVTTLTSNTVTTPKIADSNVTVAKLESSLKAEVVTREASFEAGELGAYPIRMSYAGSVTNYYGMVTKVMGGTDAGTVIVKNNAGTTMTMSTPVSIPLSTAIGTAYETTITANNTFVAGDVITVFTAKTTAGGKIANTLGIVRS